MKLILLSTQDDGLQIFFDPQTGEFFTITVELELEKEDGAEDETLLDSASKLAHSVCARDLLRRGVTNACSRSQRFGGNNSLPTHPSIFTTGNQVRPRDLNSEENSTCSRSIALVLAYALTVDKSSQKETRGLGLDKVHFPATVQKIGERAVLVNRPGGLGRGSARKVG